MANAARPASQTARASGNARQRHHAGREPTAPGDVILIEQQMAGPNYNGTSDNGLVPVEWDQSGAIVGGDPQRDRSRPDRRRARRQRLPGPRLRRVQRRHGQNWFSYDSGAIMVGAGNARRTAAGPPSRAAGSSYSNYGGRLNVQGWGSCVTTTGYGGLQGGSGGTPRTRAAFSGTSSASPIVAAARRRVERRARRRRDARRRRRPLPAPRHRPAAGVRRRPDRPAARTCAPAIAELGPRR